jgi:hypothetical protein
MTEPRKPIFGFLWAKPDPNAPVDSAYRQVRPVRITGRGPVRVLMLVTATALTVALAGSTVTAALDTRALLPTLLGAAVTATAIALVLRGWVVGTYVSDDAIRVETTVRRREVPWTSIGPTLTMDMPSPLLGLPWHVDAQRCVLRLVDGTTLATHVYTSSPDLWLRPEAFDMARLRLERWRDGA